MARWMSFHRVNRSRYLTAAWESRLLAFGMLGPPQNVLVLAGFGGQFNFDGSESGLVGFVVACVELGNYDVPFDSLIRLAARL